MVYDFSDKPICMCHMGFKGLNRNFYVIKDHT